MTPTHRAIPPLSARLAPARSSVPQLEIAFGAARGRTYLTRQRVTHPFHLCRALYRPDDRAGMATLYVQGCAGGLFEHDRLALHVRAEAGARAHVTTAAATIVHRMPNGGHAEQALTLQVAAGALLEYCPDPLIMFPRSRLRTRLHIELAPHARALVMDSFLAHQLVDDETPFDWLESTTTVESDEGELRARERYVAHGEVLQAAYPGVSGPYGCQGGLWVLGAGAEPLAPLRAALAELPDAIAGVSTLPSETGVMVRLLARDGVALRHATHRAWSAARMVLGESAGRARPK